MKVQEHAITIGKPAEELHRLWREPGTLASVMAHFAEVDALDGERTRWRAEGPLGRKLEWEARIVEERPGELLRWEAREGADLPNDGALRFRKAPEGWGTEVWLTLRFDPPGGVLGEAVAKLFGTAPGRLAHKALRRFKNLAEAGEIPTLRGNPSARGRAVDDEDRHDADE